MEELLRSEGIEFDEKGCVILEKYLWKPKKNAVSKKWLFHIETAAFLSAAVILLFSNV